MGESRVRLRGADPVEARRLRALLGPELAEHRLALEKEWDRLERERLLAPHAEPPVVAGVRRTAEREPGR